ncbi:MAG: hypothetical protein U1E45_12710 [Geminicoccaceae bacterium]
MNVQGNLLPIDVDGDGTYELLHYNGYRTMRVYRQDGRKLWQIDNPKGRVHRTNVHRDAIAVLDTDGDGTQEILHCWVDPATGKRKLVRRDGATGLPLAMSKPIDGVGAECQIAVYRMTGSANPLLFLACNAPLASNFTRNFVDGWSYTNVFDMALKRLWSRTTCNAGHYPKPLDTDNNGTAEAVFVGEYLYDAAGNLLCTLPGWGTYHVDSMSIGEFDPTLPGAEVLTVGATGTRLYSAAGCPQRWMLKNAVIRNPQHTQAVQFDRKSPPVLFVRQKRSEPLRITYRISAQGVVLSSYSDLSPTVPVPQENANLDGAPAAEDLVTWFGQVLDANGARRLTVDWFWKLQTLLPGEETLGPFDQWASVPVAFDLDHDGVSELIVWGRERIRSASWHPCHTLESAGRSPAARSGITTRYRCCKRSETTGQGTPTWQGGLAGHRCWLSSS